MKEVKVNHYVETAIYSCDVILRNLKNALKGKLDKLNLGITSEQFVVLDTISCFKNIYQQQLAEILMKDKSNTARIVKILEDKGLIIKTTGISNNRPVHILQVTADGDKILSRSVPKMKKYIAEIFTTIPDEEIEHLHVLGKVFQKDLIDNADLV